MQENSVTKKRLPLTLHEFRKSQFLRALKSLTSQKLLGMVYFSFDLDLNINYFYKIYNCFL